MIGERVFNVSTNFIVSFSLSGARCKTLGQTVNVQATYL